MAKKPPTKSPANARQAKIQAAGSTSSGGANKIVVAAVVIVVAIIAIVVAVIWQQSAATKSVVGDGNATPAGVAMGAGFPAPLSADAAAGVPTVDVYEDFQCPACGKLEAELGSTIKQLEADGKVKVVYHIKNFLDDNLRNDSSTRAANAAFCADDAGKFQEFHDAVYANQPATEGQGWTDAQFTGFAQTAGITGDTLKTWTTCFENNKYVNYVNSVDAQSSKDGVNGTPTVKIDGTTIKTEDFATVESANAWHYDPTKFEALITAATK